MNTTQIDVSDRLAELVDQVYTVGQAIGALRDAPLDADQTAHLQSAEMALLEVLTHTKRAQLRIAADPSHWRPTE